MIAAWVMWAQLFPYELPSASSEHASRASCRKEADLLNRTAKNISDEYTQQGGPNPYRGMFDQPYSCWPQGHIPKPRR